MYHSKTQKHPLKQLAYATFASGNHTVFHLQIWLIGVTPRQLRRLYGSHRTSTVVLNACHGCALEGKVVWEIADVGEWVNVRRLGGPRLAGLTGDCYVHFAHVRYFVVIRYAILRILFCSKMQESCMTLWNLTRKIIVLLWYANFKINDNKCK